MLGLTFKESGASLDDIISALNVELEKLAGKSFDRQAIGGAVAAGKNTSRGRAEPRSRRRRLPSDRKALTASGIEQSIADAELRRPRRRKDRPGGRYGRGRRKPRTAPIGPGQVQTDVEASALIELVAAQLTGACEAAGFEVKGSSKSAGTGETLSRTV